MSLSFGGGPPAAKNQMRRNLQGIQGLEAWRGWKLLVIVRFHDTPASRIGTSCSPLSGFLFLGGAPSFGRYDEHGDTSDRDYSAPNPREITVTEKAESDGPAKHQQGHTQHVPEAPASEGHMDEFRPLRSPRVRSNTIANSRECYRGRSDVAKQN